MSDRVFLDTNTLIYAHSNTEPFKKRAVEQILLGTAEVILSTQVINEFINAMYRKRKIPISVLAITVQELMINFPVMQISTQSIQLALEISQRYHFSYFDSLIVASALENNCSVLYSEDMHHSQVIESTMTIINPFSGL